MTAPALSREQAIFCHALIEHSYDNGFRLHPLMDIAQLTPLTLSACQLYDANTETGILWPFDSRSGDPLAGILGFHTSPNGQVSVCVYRDALYILESWAANRTEER
jgi:hypothetical protein